MISTPSIFSPYERNASLDGLRGVAILLVILVHATVITPVTTLDRVALTPLLLGWVGVDLFFVLSGFLITSILVENRGGPGYFSSFYARRFLRIFPLYYLVLFVTLVLLPQIPHPKHADFAKVEGTEPSYWAFLSNFAMAADNDFTHPILAVTWSLSIEEQFYALWPLVVLLVGPRGLRWLCPLLVAGSLLCRLTLMYAWDVGPIPLYVLTPCRLDGLAAGAWLAVWIRNGYHPAQHARRLKVTFSVCLGVMLLAEAAHVLRLPEGAYSYSRFACGPGFTLLAAGFAALLLLALDPRAWPPLAGLLRSPVLRSFGKYSYGIYLLHSPARAVLRDLVLGPPQPGAWPLVEFPVVGGSQLLGQLAFYPPAIALSWLVGWLSWRVVERPFLRLKRRFPYQRDIATRPVCLSLQPSDDGCKLSLQSGPHPANQGP